MSNSTTQIPVTSLKSYESLVHPSIRLYLETHGDTGNFAFGIHCIDPEMPESQSDSLIRGWHNLISNFDSRPKISVKNGEPEFPAAPRLSFIGPKLAYFNVTKERLKQALVLYFTVNLPLRGDVSTSYYYDEITEIECWERDEEEIARLAEECAQLFMDEQVVHYRFMPTNTRQVLSEFVQTTERLNRESESLFEQLIDRAQEN